MLLLGQGICLEIGPVAEQPPLSFFLHPSPHPDTSAAMALLEFRVLFPSPGCFLCETSQLMLTQPVGPDGQFAGLLLYLVSVRYLGTAGSFLLCVLD